MQAMKPATLCLLVLISVGCSAQKSLSRSEAGKVLAKSKFFQPTTLSVAIGPFCSQFQMAMLKTIVQNPQNVPLDPALPYYMAAYLEPIGATALSPSDEKQRCGRNLFPYEVWLHNFIPANAPDWHQTKTEGRSVFYTVDVLTTELQEVTGIVSDSAVTATVEFNWQPLPTKSAMMFKMLSVIPKVSHNGSADFKLYDDGWRVVSVRFQ